MKELGLGYRLAIAVLLFVMLFLVEYPPIFLLGYWSWSGWVHKTLTGVLLVLNLLVVQYATRRLGLFQAVPNALRA